MGVLVLLRHDFFMTTLVSLKHIAEVFWVFSRVTAVRGTMTDNCLLYHSLWNSCAGCRLLAWELSVSVGAQLDKVASAQAPLLV